MDNTTTAVLFNDKDDVYLEWLNDKFAATKLGGVIFIGIMMVIGIIGNLHVLYIYALKFKRSTHRIYILCLAMVDTVTCCIGMPFVIVDLQNPLLFRAIAVCKILRFLNYFMCSTSAILLVVIAVDRYKNICHPFEVQMTERRAKIACGISILIGLILSWPAPILYGASTVGTKMISSYLHIEVKANITGTQCFTVDKFFGTPYQTIFNIVLIGIILILTTVLGVLYSLICRAVIQQAQNFQKMTKSINNGLKTTAGQIYKNEFPKISPEHTSSSADSRSTLSDGLSDTQKRKTEICGDSDGVKQNVHNNSSDFNEGVKHNILNDQNLVQCIYVSNMDDIVLNKPVINNSVYQNVDDSDKFETTVSQEYQNVFTEKELNEHFRKNHGCSYLKENETNNIQNAGESQNGTEIFKLQDNQKKRTPQSDVVGTGTSEVGLSDSSDVLDVNQEEKKDCTYKNEFYREIPPTNEDNQRRLTYENIELRNCENGNHTLNQNTYENIEVKVNDLHSLTMEGNIFCNEDVDVTKMNGEQPNTIYMDPIENQLTKETNVANKNQVFDLSVISNRGQIHCQSSENNTYINVKPHTTKEPKTRKTYNRERQAKRITLMLFIITLVFVLSFIPHLTLKILAFVRKDFLTSLSYTQLFLYHTFVWSFFINNMANPIIYGFCDSVFRKEIKKTYKYIFKKCKSCVKYRSYSLN